LSREEVLKLAALSRLRLTDDEVEKLRSELSSIIDYVKQLDSVDTKSLEPTYQVTGLKNVMRQDTIHDYGYQPAELLKNAPAFENGQFKVKRILE